MTQSLSETIAGQVRAEAARQKISVGEIGSWLGVSRQAASARLNGKPAFTTDQLEILAARFGVRLAQLIGTEQNGSAA